MRPQQNRRMRGRSGGGGNNQNQNQNRRGPNPLTRNYESNGPDVKIRGSAQQIAEKYTTLARDAQSSGDRVMAENYLQHAEHYNRIIMAAQAQMPQPVVRDTRDDDEADGETDENFVPAQQAEQPRQPEQAEAREERRTETRSTAKEQVQDQAQDQAEQQVDERNDGTGPQPVIDGFPTELAQESPAPVKARTPRRRVAAKVEVAQPEAPQKETQAAADAAAPEAASGTAAVAEQEEVQPRVRRPRRPRIKAAEAEDADATPAAGDEIITEAAQ